MTVRDRARERAFLDAAMVRAPSAHRAEFLGHVQRRLDSGQNLYGDCWTTLGIRRLLGELLEEAARAQNGRAREQAVLERWQAEHGHEERP